MSDFEAPSVEEIERRIKPPPTRKTNYWRRTPQRARAIYVSLANGQTRTASALTAGIDDNTFWRWLHDDPGFADLVAEAEGVAESYYANIVHNAAPTTWQAAAWWLERRRNAEYGRKDKVEQVSLDIRVLAETLAEAEGLPKDRVLAEAFRIIETHKAAFGIGPGEVVGESPDPED